MCVIGVTVTIEALCRCMCVCVCNFCNCDILLDAWCEFVCDCVCVCVCFPAWLQYIKMDVGMHFFNAWKAHKIYCTLHSTCYCNEHGCVCVSLSVYTFNTYNCVFLLIFSWTTMSTLYLCTSQAIKILCKFSKSFFSSYGRVSVCMSEGMNHSWHGIFKGGKGCFFFRKVL